MCEVSNLHDEYLMCFVLMIHLVIQVNPRAWLQARFC